MQHPESADDSLFAYLQALAGEAPESAYLELRHRVSDYTLAAEFYPVHDRVGLVRSIRAHAARTDVYVGCAPRTRRAGTKDAVELIWILWAECDGVAAARAAMEYRPRPAIVIASGSGANLHAYWPLRQPLLPPAAEVANLRLAHALGADAACYDAARILRPPGSWNHKRQPPTAVTTLKFDHGMRFDASSVVERAPHIDDRRVRLRWRAQQERDPGSDPLLHLTPPTYVSGLLGVEARAGRKVRCPFHADERPSLHVYPTAARGWCCFSCGRGGSIYDLASALWGLGTRGRDFVEVRRRLLERFSVHRSYVGHGLER